MRRICAFVPAATATAPAPGTTANAHPPTTPQRHVTKMAGVGVGSRAGRAILRAARSGASTGGALPFVPGSTRQGQLAPHPVAVESIGPRS
jgi:hypothetical protein